MEEKEWKKLNGLLDKYIWERYSKFISGFEQKILTQMSTIKKMNARAKSDDNSRKVLNEIIKSLDEKLTICHQKLMRL